MKINNIDYSYNNNCEKTKFISLVFNPKKTKITQNTSYPNLTPLKEDCVTFKGKNYSVSDIKEPTGHCAYCGEKVYTKDQLKSLAIELLNLKGSKLQGKIRSITEKLAKKDSISEIFIEKREINKDDIHFFEKLATYSYKRPTEIAGKLLEEYLGMDKQERCEEVMKHLKPLLKTVDHVSPQRKSNQHDHADINLVEACYTCNHDIKQGKDFDKFYEMYPSISETMPHDKFEYAKFNLVENPTEQLESLAKTDEIIKQTTTLLSQYAQTQNSLNSIKLRLDKTGKKLEIALKREIREKNKIEKEIKAKEQEYETLMQNPEYIARNKRKEDMKNLQEKKDKLQKFENQIKKSTAKNTKKETEKNIRYETENLKAEINTLEYNIKSSEKEYPSIKTLKQRQEHAQNVKNAYNEIDEKKNELEKMIKKSNELIFQKSKYETILEQKNIPEPTNITQADENTISEYEYLVELAELTKNSDKTDDKTKNIYNFAGNYIDTRIKELAKSSDFIAVAEQKRQKENAETNLLAIEKETDSLQRQIKKTERTITDYEEKISSMTLNEAEKKIKENKDELKRVEKIYYNLKTKERTERMRTEENLCDSAISSLEEALENIDKILTK